MDTSNVQFRKPSETLIDKFRTDKDFIYDRAKNPENLWEIISVWISELLRNLFDSKGFQIVSNYFGYIILIAAIIIVVIILNKSKLQGVLYSSEETSALNLHELNENIHEIDFDDLINNSLRNKEYRVAVRYYYLKTLKLMTDNGIIDWRIDKTNYQFVKEISERGLKASFSELTDLFEWIWYGETVIENTFFENTRQKFDSFNEKLAAKK